MANKRPLGEILDELEKCERERKRLRGLVDCHPDSLRKRLPGLLIKLLLDTGRLTEYTVKFKEAVEVEYINGSSDALYNKDELRTSVTLDGQHADFTAYYWHYDDVTWKATKKEFWTPSHSDRYTPGSGKGWEFLVAKNSGNELRALASLAVVSYEEDECCYRTDSVNSEDDFYFSREDDDVYSDDDSDGEEEQTRTGTR